MSVSDLFRGRRMAVADMSAIPPENARAHRQGWVGIRSSLVQPRPAAFLEQLHEPTGDRHRVEEDRVEELHELVGHVLVEVLRSLVSGGVE
jgi:hypothetical protein